MEGTKPKRILVIDSNPDILHLIENVVRKLKNDLRTASSLAEADRIFEKERFDVLICDVGVSDGSCDRFVESVHKKSPEMPIIVFTDGYRYSSLSSRVRTDYCFIVERFNFQQLAEVLKELIAEPSE
jgi:DNA-binding NtrC family response regulator